MTQKAKASPSKILFGFEQRNHCDNSLTWFTNAPAKVDIALENERQITRDTALHATDALRNYNKMYRDTHSKKPTLYKEGDYILIKDNRNKIGVSNKLKPSYKGPNRKKFRQQSLCGHRYSRLQHHTKAFQYYFVL